MLFWYLSRVNQLFEERECLRAKEHFDTKYTKVKRIRLLTTKPVHETIICEDGYFIMSKNLALHLKPIKIKYQ